MTCFCTNSSQLNAKYPLQKLLPWLVQALRHFKNMLINIRTTYFYFKPAVSTRSACPNFAGFSNKVQLFPSISKCLVPIHIFCFLPLPRAFSSHYPYLSPSSFPTNCTLIQLQSDSEFCVTPNT